MKSVFAERELCRSCGACRAACPTSAIAMRPDAKGTTRPAIDQEKCISCRNCLAVCPALCMRDQEKTATPALYVVGHESEEVLSALSGTMRGAVVHRSNGDETYETVVKNLREGRTVFFTGTPDQAAGLRGLMCRKVYSTNLYTCEMGKNEETHSVADISIVDTATFTSLVTVHTPKGEALWNATKSGMLLNEHLFVERTA